jgi:hypothetical protein
MKAQKNQWKLNYSDVIDEIRDALRLDSLSSYFEDGENILWGLCV